MTEESQSDEQALPEKLQIDNLSDFQFHAAYLAYSNIFDKASNPDTKRQLNDNIVALQKDEIDYPTFYKNIRQSRSDPGLQPRNHRALIRTQRKREWRRKTQKRERNKRHKK